MRYIIFFLLMVVTFNGYGQELSSLLENAQQYDGKDVTVTGEVIGEVLYAPQGVWLNILTDAGVNIGVFCAQESQIQDIKHYGSYTHRGDRIRIEGVFYSNCPQHSERDIHAYSVSVVERGKLDADTVSEQEKNAAIILAGVCGILAIIYLVKISYGRKHHQH